MTKQEYLKIYKRRLERIRDNVDAADDAIAEIEVGEDFEKVRDYIESIMVDIVQDAAELDRMCLEEVTEA